MLGRWLALRSLLAAILVSQIHVANSLEPRPTFADVSNADSVEAKAGRVKGGNSWLGNVVSTLERIRAKEPVASPDLPVSVAQALGKAPGIVKGLAGLDTTVDAHSLFAALFGDPRAPQTPRWMKGFLHNATSSMADRDLTRLTRRSASRRDLDLDGKVQTLLAHVFSDAGQEGMESIDVPLDSSADEVVPAISSNEGLVASLSSRTQELLGELQEELGLQILQYSQGTAYDTTSQCAKEVGAFIGGLQKGQMWSYQMLDAMGKLQAGLLTGQTTLVGDYMECMDAFTHDDPSSIQTVFCGAIMPFPGLGGARSGYILSILGNLRLHVCLPKSCRDDQIFDLIKPTAKALGTDLLAIDCSRPKDTSGDARFLGACIVFGILALLCALGTAIGVYVDSTPRPKYSFDLEVKNHVINGLANGKTANGDHMNGSVKESREMNGVGEKMESPANPGTDPSNVAVEVGTSEKENGVVGKEQTDEQTADTKDGLRGYLETFLPTRLLLCFSVLRNGRAVLDCTQRPGQMSCLHGIRAISITWVVLGHVFTQDKEPQGNKTADTYLMKYWTFVTVVGSLVTVDTFFLLSGVLMAYIFLKATRKTGVTGTGMVLYYLHRFLRLTPLYAVVLAFYLGIFPYLKRGPYQNQMGMETEGSCLHYWWHNLLYINTVVENRVSSFCLGESWYLSNDLIYTYLAPLALIPWTFRGRWRKLGITVGFLVAMTTVVVQIIVTAVLVYKNDASLINNNDYFLEEIFFVPWCRAGPYGVGLMLGYFLYTTKCRFTMTKVAAVCGWVLAWAGGLFIIYINHTNLNDLVHGTSWSRDENAAYEALYRVTWSVCVAWVIFACVNGYGGFVNTLLSWSAWLPLSRLTFGVYMVHLMFLHVITANYMKPFYKNGWTGAQLMVALTVYSFLGSFVLSMLIETPAHNLEKILLNKIAGRKKSTK